MTQKERPPPEGSGEGRDDVVASSNFSPTHRPARTKFPVRPGQYLGALLDAMEAVAHRQGPISDYVARLILDARSACNVSAASRWQGDADVERFAVFLGRITHSLEVEQAHRLGMTWDAWLAAGLQQETTR